MEEKRKKRDRTFYLNSSTDLISRQVYAFIKKQAKNKEENDLKSIKELCSILKETVNISLSLQKTDDCEKDTLHIAFDDEILELSE
ncbi:MAG: hypothetical protein J1E34_03470 [Oscillospiraceae bacterium]|nr:hypothetical protein [Oscillospiraceae bacterium]